MGKHRRKAILECNTFNINNNKTNDFVSNKRNNGYSLNKNRNLKKYGLTTVDFFKMFKNQNGCCEICGNNFLINNTRICIDHDHINGKVRGLLCNNCNSGIGFLKDNLDYMLNAIEYIKKYSTE